MTLALILCFDEYLQEISTGVTAVSDEGQKDENKTLNRFKDICACKFINMLK